MNTSNYNIVNDNIENDNTLMYLYGAMTLFAALSFIINKTAKLYEEIEEVNDIDDEISELKVTSQEPTSEALIIYTPSSATNSHINIRSDALTIYTPSSSTNNNTNIRSDALTIYTPSSSASNYIVTENDNDVSELGYTVSEPDYVNEEIITPQNTILLIQDSDNNIAVTIEPTANEKKQNIIKNYTQHLEGLYKFIREDLITINSTAVDNQKNSILKQFNQILKDMRNTNHDNISTLPDKLKRINISDTIDVFHKKIIDLEPQQPATQGLFARFTAPQIEQTQKFKIIHDKRYVAAIKQFKLSLVNFIDNLTLQNYCLQAIKLLESLAVSNNEANIVLQDSIEQIQLRISNLEFILENDKGCQKDIISMFAKTICELIDINTGHLEPIEDINILKENLNTLFLVTPPTATAPTVVTEERVEESAAVILTAPETTSTELPKVTRNGFFSSITSLFNKSQTLEEEVAEAGRDKATQEASDQLEI